VEDAFRDPGGVADRPELQLAASVFMAGGWYGEGGGDDDGGSLLLPEAASTARVIPVVRDNYLAGCSPGAEAQVRRALILGYFRVFGKLSLKPHLHHRKPDIRSRHRQRGWL
jgi:hypothetical protein